MPEIYNKVKEQLGEREYYVVEDSLHGVESGLQAGMRAIFFNQRGNTADKAISFDVSSMNNLLAVVPEIAYGYRVVSLLSDVEMRVVEHSLDVRPRDAVIVNEIWRSEKEQNEKLFNGEVLSYVRHSKELLLRRYLLRAGMLCAGPPGA